MLRRRQVRVHVLWTSLKTCVNTIVSVIVYRVLHDTDYHNKKKTQNKEQQNKSYSKEENGANMTDSTKQQQ